MTETTGWRVFFLDPASTCERSSGHPTEAHALGQVAKLWERGLLLRRIEAPDGEIVPHARILEWLDRASA